MAKRARKAKVTDAERAEIEADRIAAHQQAVEVLDAELPPLEAVTEPSAALVEMYEEELKEEIEAEGLEAEEEPKEPNSIVKDKFKIKYAENAAAIGDKRKQVKRSNWDWLAQQIAGFCLGDKGKIDIRAFVALLNVNGVDHSRWTNKNRGWEGRFRMTGRVALQKVVANSGFLYLPSEGTLPEPFEAPADWCAKYKTKA